MSQRNTQEAFDYSDSIKTSGLIHSEELREINKLHSYPLNTIIQLTSRNPIRKFFHKLRIRLIKILLGDYFKEEQDFNSNLIRYINEFTRRIDSHFWRDVQEEHSATLLSAEKRIHESLGQIAREINARISKLETTEFQHNSQLITLESVTLGLEQIVSQLNKNIKRMELPQAELLLDTNNSSETRITPDYTYLLLENRYRGSEAEISKRLEKYPQLFKNSPAKVLEIGSGRGELQELFRKEEISSYGIETDLAMIELCKEKNLNVQLGEAIEHLRSLPESSLGGIIAIQVIEHLNHSQLSNLLKLAYTKLSPGSYLIFETINTTSLTALGHNYFRDPTHSSPRHPETMRFLMELSGFSIIQLELLSPFPAEAILQPIEVAPYMTPRWQQAVEILNRNFQQLNNLLYGFQDYYIVGQKIREE